MLFPINLSGNTLYTIMRKCGYTPNKEKAFQRFLRGDSYPKFHIYASLSSDGKSALLNLHLDQKQPTYKGSHAHSAEYSGPFVEAEFARIQKCLSSRR